MMIGFLLLAAAIQLTGVTGSDLRVRAFFDAHNVKVGDPLVLTVDFLGTAEFKDLHPPALARAVDARDWKLDDASAKTDTFRDARRLTYRVRPRREGLLLFPALEFAYSDETGGVRLVRANSVPLHAKAGAQVVVAEMKEDPNALPEPPALLTTLTRQLDDDTAFLWRKACARPSAEAFTTFDFPEARLNEATCAIREGNWARALALYRRVEWTLGQTPEIERGIRAALALKADNPAVELPVWRQVLRPILRFGWRGRVGLVVGGFAAFALLFYLLGRGIRAVATFAFALLLVGSGTARAEDPFALFEQMHRRMQQQMNQMSAGFSMSFGGEEQPTPTITARVALSKPMPQVGEDFAFILSLEAPKSASIGQVRLTPSETFGLTFTGSAENLSDAPSANPTNVIKRLSVPARFDVPYKGDFAFAVDGMVSDRQTRGNRFSFTFSNSFHAETPRVPIAVRPLPTAGQPDDFAGLISDGVRLVEVCDILKVETNDVVVISYHLTHKGYAPANYQPKDVAFEWARAPARNGRAAEIEYRRFFVADGAPMTPVLSVSYYNPRTRKYERAKVGGTRLHYYTATQAMESEVTDGKAH